MTIATWAERLAWTGALVALIAWAALRLSGSLGAQRSLREFAAAQAQRQLAADRATATGSVGGEQRLSLTSTSPDQRLWSAKRVYAWRDTFSVAGPAPLAILRLPRIGLEVAVLEGTDDWTLNRAVGHIENTATPGTNGNIGIAGHRDGFFRALEQVQMGDRLEIQTLDDTRVYRIARTWIVAPEDVSVLDPTPAGAVTLVTCYPFYFVGPAPQRFIVRAEPVSTAP